MRHASAFVNVSTAIWLVGWLVRGDLAGTPQRLETGSTGDQ